MENNDITLSIDGKEVVVEKGQTILQAAQKLGIFIPTLCYNKNFEPQGACRLCMVEVETNGRSKLVASCAFPAADGINVSTDTETVIQNRKIVAELLLARSSGNQFVKDLCEKIGVTDTPFIKEKEECVLCGLCVQMCNEKMKIGAVNFIGRGQTRKIGTPYDEKSEVCITCGACEHICPTGAITASTAGNTAPVTLGKDFDEKLASRGNIDILFPSAVPLAPSIDSSNCIHFQIGDDACGICRDSCPADAIDFKQTEKETTINVGAVITAPGFESFNPGNIDTFDYDSNPNVITSMEFERVLSAGGPFKGHITRFSDGKEPKKIAWLQCVGSRGQCDEAREYCSSVCCMYAMKQAMIAKAHLGDDLETTIFFMDMRAHGKEFERYYQSAVNRNIHFVRSRIHTIRPVADTGDVIMRHVSEAGEIKEDIFDMAILSVGLEINQGAVDLADKLGIKLNPNNFVDASTFNPVSTSKSGIYSCGLYTGPKDIPQTVMEASAAASASTSILSSERGTLLKEKEYPAEKDITGETPRVGVFVCNCGINIGGIADVPSLVEYAGCLPEVKYTQENLFSCSRDALNNMAEMIKEHNLNRIVVAACSPLTHEPIFRETLRNSGLNKYLFEMANIRNHCTWCHQDEKEQATEKCKDLINMAVSKARLIEPLPYISVGIENKALVIGGGVSGMTSALGLSRQGYKVFLVEEKEKLGGNALKLNQTWKGEKVAPFIESLIHDVNHDDNITIYLGCTVEDASGFVGNFKSKISNGEEIAHGIVVMSTGGQAYKPEGMYLYGQNPDVLLSTDLDSEIANNSNRIKDAETAVFIQCVGSRIPERIYCSKVCCTHSIENALELKKINPELNVYIIYRDIRTYGEKESLYKEAREKGVIFIRYDLDNLPIVEDEQGKIKITVKDHVLQQPIEVKADILTLASSIIPNDNEPLSKLYKVAMNEYGFFNEIHPKLRPVDSATEGVFISGLCQFPKPVEESVAQSLAAASRASTILSKDEIEMDSLISHPNDKNCDGCAYCIAPCSFDAITLIEYMKNGEVKKTVEVNEVLCKGCGSCMATCPKQGINVAGFTLEQLNAQVEAAIGIA